MTVERELQPTCTPEMKEVIWRTLEPLLSKLGRTDVQNIVVEGDARPLPNVSPDWRTQAAAPATPIVRGLRLPFSTTEFDVTSRDFADLEIRGSQDSSGFHYLYDTRARRMITDFVLGGRPQVATLCNVTVIKKGDTFTPRIKLWKKDKKKAGEVSATHTVPDTGSTRAIKALVDTGDVHENFWKVINFLQGCVGLSTPGDSLQLVAGDEGQLTQLLAGQDRDRRWAHRRGHQADQQPQRAAPEVRAAADRSGLLPAGGEPGNNAWGRSGLAGLFRGEPVDLRLRT
ncbi:hypothetical protein ABT373_27055 [Streptomyces sp. NPDC000070]|uniref:hypothetical protein n=1 Tax=Streptomyces sp. NPDC000070 TaxID=3154240 RepID=UPI003329862D